MQSHWAVKMKKLFFECRTAARELGPEPNFALLVRMADLDVRDLAHRNGDLATLAVGAWADVGRGLEGAFPVVARVAAGACAGFSPAPSAARASIALIADLETIR